jgi:hypothetical protein
MEPFSSYPPSTPWCKHHTKPINIIEIRTSTGEWSKCAIVSMILSGVMIAEEVTTIWANQHRCWEWKRVEDNFELPTNSYGVLL